MTGQVKRRLRLPADHNSPGAARTAVRAALSDVGLTVLLDEALLLTTELTTNGVVHAGTDLDLDVVADPDSITVTVLDFHSGLLPIDRVRLGKGSIDPSGHLAERGRGLLLVDQLANCWGTLHHPGGKGVWFRLDRPGATVGTSAVPVVPRADTRLDPADLASLNPPPALLRDSANLADTAADLLCRLCAVTGAAGATVTVDEGAGRPGYTLAEYGAPVAGGPRHPLRLTRSWSGTLLLAPTAHGYAGPLAELTAERLSLMIENRRLRHSDSEQRGWLTFLSEASELLAQSLDVELTLALVPQLVVPRLGPWCAVHVADAAGELSLATTTHADETARAALSADLVDALPQLRAAARNETAVQLAGELDGVTVGLVARGQSLGTLTVGRNPERRLDSAEVAVLEDVARRAALAVDNARIHAERRAVAQALQRSLLPPTLPTVTGIEFGAEYVPTGEGVEVGGDFYDVVALPDNSWLVVVGDVSGKGVQAATVTGLVRDVTRVLVRDGRPLPEALARLNETLVERGGGRFCTLALATVTPHPDGRLDVSLYLAGHEPPVLIRPDGTTSLVGACGTALGLLSSVTSPVATLALAPGDTLVFFTDGVTERRRGMELFGIDRLRREAAAAAGFPADVVAARLRAATLGFSPDAPRDDIAIFALRNELVEVAVA